MPRCGPMTSARPGGGCLIWYGAAPLPPRSRKKLPSLPELVKQIFRRSPPRTIDSPTALLIACGSEWQNEDGLFDWQTRNRPLETQDSRTKSQLLEAMLRHGGNINAQGGGYGPEQQWTPLEWAIYSNDSNTTGILLKHGAVANRRDGAERDPLLYIAVLYCTSPNDSIAKDIIRQLLAHGADPNLPGAQGDTALLFAQRNHHPALVALLKQYSARKPEKRP